MHRRRESTALFLLISSYKLLSYFLRHPDLFSKFFVVCSCLHELLLCRRFAGHLGSFQGLQFGVEFSHRIP